MARYVVRAEWTCEGTKQEVLVLIPNAVSIENAIALYMQYGCAEPERNYMRLTAELISYTLKV